MGDSRTEQYPRDLLQFERQFGTEEACRDYLATLRWPEGFRCRRCGSTRAWSRKARALMECAGCGYQSSITAGTIFDRTRIPLTIGFRAMWLVTNAKNGISALSVQRQLGFKRYETAWTLLHKLRRAMVRPACPAGGRGGASLLAEQWPLRKAKTTTGSGYRTQPDIPFSGIREDIRELRGDVKLLAGKVYELMERPHA